MSGSLYFRLRIRNADDDANLVTYSTLPTDTAPYLQGPPSGDGQRIDPITGKSSIGAYTVRVVDVATGSTRAVTSNLVDSAKRQQLMGRRAYIESSTDGSTWGVMVAGYVNRVRLIGALVYEFNIGETQRVEQNLEIFKTVTKTYDQVSCICGGPVRGGFGPLGDFGPWKMRVAQVYPGKFVRLKFLSGYIRRSVETFFVQFPTGGYQFAQGGLSIYEDKRVNEISREFYEPLDGKLATLGLTSEGIAGWYPKLEARVENASGTVLGYFTPLNRIDDTFKVGSVVVVGGHIALVDNSDLNLLWDGTHGLDSNRVGGEGHAPDQPDDESIVYVYVYPTEITEDNPIHLKGHPVDIITGLWDDAGLAYSATAAATAKSALGGLWLNLRIGKSYKLNEFVEAICGFSGLAVRFNSSGERSLVSTRIRSSTAPTTTITLDDLRSVSPSIFDVDESKMVNKVTVKSERYTLWAPEKFGKDSKRPIDELVVTPVTNSVSDDSAPMNGEHEQTYDIPGQILMQGMPSVLGDLAWLVNPVPTETAYTLALATEIFDRRKTGSITGELACLRGVTAVPGDEIILDLDHLPNDNDRGGERIVQVLGRTETPGGPTLYVEDAGVSTQPATTPTYSIAKATNADPKRFALVSLTNAASLILDGSSCRIEYSIGSSSTDWIHAATLTPTDLATITSWTTPQVDAGSVVNVRMRAEQPGKRPSAYGTTKSVTLTALTAPTSLNATAVTDDNSAADLSWTAGETTQPVVVEWKETAATNYDHSVTLPAGSTKYRVRGLTASTAYTFRVKYREQAPWAGESSAITDTLTTGSTAPDCTAPENPRAFAGSIDPATGGTVVDGTYGLEVIPTEFPGFTVFTVAKETSAGSGTYGTYEPVPRGTVENVQGARTVWRGIAPNDGLRRSIKAKATAPGKDDSANTTAVDVDPWTATAPTDLPVTCPDITLTAVTAMSAGVGQAKIRVSFAKPTESWFSHMTYSVRFKEPNGSYGPAATVIGSKDGPDFIDAQYGLVYEVTPSTVTTGVDATPATDEGTAKTITMPGVAASPTIADTGGSSTVSYDITYDAATTSIEVWSKLFTDDPGAVSMENATGATFVTTLNRGDGRTSLELSVDSTNDWRVTTFVPYAGVQRGTPITKRTQRAASTTPPADLGTVTNDSKTTNSVKNKIVLAPSHVAGDQIETYVNDVARGSLYLITATDVSNGYALVETTGLSSNTTYTFNYKAVRDGLRSANFTTDFEVTTNTGQYDAPSIDVVRDPSDPCSVAIVTITAGANNLVNLGGDGRVDITSYTIETASSSSGPWTVKDSSQGDGDKVISITEDETFFRCKANGDDFANTSAYSAVDSVDDHTGPC